MSNYLVADWAEFKAYLDETVAVLHYLDSPNYYKCYLHNGDFYLHCGVKKGTADATDFETNYQSLANLGLSDGSGRELIRVAATTAGWSYETISVDLITSKLNSAVCEQEDTTVIPTMTLKFYDNTDTELVAGTQLELDLNCVKTVLDIQFPYDIDIIEGQIDNPLLSASDCRLWVVVAPHIPAASGGSKRMVTNKNLKLIKWAQYDGKASLRLYHDPVYNSNLFRVTIKHPTGYQHHLGLGYNYYNE